MDLSISLKKKQRGKFISHTITENEFNILSYPGISIDRNDGNGYRDVNFNTQQDWKHQALKSFKRLNELRYIWSTLSRNQKVNESHYFYDCIFTIIRVLWYE